MSDSRDRRNNRDADSAADLKELLRDACDRDKKLSRTMTHAYASISNLLTDEEKQWLKNEIGGYESSTADNKHWPPYREIAAEVVLINHNGNTSPIVFPDAETAAKFNRTPIPSSVEELEHIVAEKSSLEIRYVAETESLLSQAIKFNPIHDHGGMPMGTRPTRFVHRFHFIGVLNKIRMQFIELLERLEQVAHSKMEPASKPALLVNTNPAPISTTTLTRTTVMEKKYQVFVSSTYEDLKNERRAAYDALLRSNCIPAGMELFNAGDDAQWNVIKRCIDNCDYYFVIIAHRYGSRTPEGISYTQKEYEYAVSMGIPVAAFIIDKGESWPPEFVDQDTKDVKRLNQFKQLVKTRYVNFWKNADDLKAHCALAIPEMISQHPRPGWTREEHSKATTSNKTLTASTKLPPEEERARESILVGALDGTNGNAFNLMNTALGNEVRVAGYQYNDDPLQKALYLHTLKALEDEDFVQHKAGILYELTYKGMKLARELKANGVVQDKPKPKP